jgi:hypothetical protein
MHCPENGLDKFEEISYLLKKKEDYDINEFLKVVEKYLYNSPSVEHYYLTDNFIKNARKFFSVSYIYPLLCADQIS